MNPIPSRIFSVSVRGWIALLLVFTVCVMSAVGQHVSEPLNSALLIALGFYFGQKGGGET